jgi:hypothetical protein
MKPLAIIASVLALAASSAFAAPNCPNGVACGNTCIPKGKACHIAPPKGPNCTNGKVCGNTCIAKTATCKAPH